MCHNPTEFSEGRSPVMILQCSELLHLLWVAFKCFLLFQAWHLQLACENICAFQVEHTSICVHVFKIRNLNTAWWCSFLFCSTLSALSKRFFLLLLDMWRIIKYVLNQWLFLSAIGSSQMQSFDIRNFWNQISGGQSKFSVSISSFFFLFFSSS